MREVLGWPPLAGMAAVVAALGLLMAVVRCAQARGLLGAEAARKAVHVGMGLVVTAFPWLFGDPWPVLVLAALACGALGLVRWWPPIAGRLGGVLGGVDRDSLGEFWFPIAAATVFTASGGDPVRFCIPVLVLTLADAVAALVGLRYGHHRYTTDEGHKSWEGSVAFVFTAFLAVHVPLLLGTNVGRPECLLIAATLALLVMFAEAAAWRGLDNLFIPVGCYALLDVYLRLPAFALAWRFAATLALVLLVLAWRRRATLNDAALMGGVLAGYGFLAVGGWWWLVPPLALFLSYTRLSPPTPANSVRIHGVDAALAVTAPGLAWLFAAHTSARPELLLPAACTFAGQLACIGMARLAHDHATRPLSAIAVHSALLAGAILATAMLTVFGLSPDALQAAAAMTAGALIAVAGFAATQPGLRDCPNDRARWLRQAGWSLAASAPGAVLTLW